MTTETPSATTIAWGHPARDHGRVDGGLGVRESSMVLEPIKEVRSHGLHD